MDSGLDNLIEERCKETYTTEGVFGLFCITIALSDGFILRGRDDDGGDEDSPDQDISCEEDVQNDGVIHLAHPGPVTQKSITDFFSKIPNPAEIFSQILENVKEMFG
ncbi:uncharacterized protein [Halyomorpha halys]|uniref:uncharacterized protein n=1 Tax=Halyomorpha halys TaxID=286706 RepID=UPI0034D18762